MSNDNKTLADVQPGGRVSLGDQAERARFEDWGLTEGLPLARGKLGGYAFEVTAKAWLAWQHLSAQPSPAGQGDVLASLPLYRLADDADGNRGLHLDDTGSWVKLQDVERALVASQPVSDQHPDDLAVDAFAAAMKAKMAAARAKGRGGWEDPAQCSADDLSSMLRAHVEKGDPRDVANFCMMLHQRGEAIAARQPVGQITDTEIDARLNALYREITCSGQHNGGMSGVAWDRAVYRMASSQPAQALDLGQFREAVQVWLQSAVWWGRHGREKCEEAKRLLALIDSQAVGNG